jgi:CBS domain-containing protein
MSSPVISVKENDNVQHACKTMIDNGIGCVIVVVADQPNALAGIITERDIVRHLAEKPISFAAASKQIMSKPLVTIHPNGSVRDALQAMQTRDIRRLVVVDDNGKNMIGIVTDKDIFRFISRNESITSAFVREEVLTTDRGISERFNANLLDDLIRRRP